MLSIGVKELLDSGVHFGHQTKRWNPKMKPFIFDARNGIHIIDLSKTLTQLEAACDFLAATVRKGGKVMFVGTKKQAQQCVKETAKECGQFYVTERWLGGTLTNYNTIKTSIKRLKEIEKMNTDGTMANYVKQEQAMIRREAGRFQKYFDGIRAMDKIPAAMFVVDIKREHNAMAEARKLKVPIVAIVDTNCDPDLVIIPSPRTTTPSGPCDDLAATSRPSRWRRRSLSPSAPARRRKKRFRPQGNPLKLLRRRRWRPFRRCRLDSGGREIFLRPQSQLSTNN